jgi:radical SAM-linked protein
MHNCGICFPCHEIVENNIHDDKLLYAGNLAPDDSMSAGRKAGNNPDPDISGGVKDPVSQRILFSFTKLDSAVFHSHLTLVEVFSMAFVRAGLPIAYSRGFNPLPRLEIAFPLALGIFSRGEMASVDTEEFLDAETFKQKLTSELPQGMEITRAMNVHIESGVKKHSLSSLLWGSAYRKHLSGDPPGAEPPALDYVKASEDKKYREEFIGLHGAVYGLERVEVLARQVENQAGVQDRGDSYFDVYRNLYAQG